MTLFEYAVVRTEGPIQAASLTPSPTILVPVTVVLAKDEATVRMIAARAIPGGENLEDAEILVRPFC